MASPSRWRLRTTALSSQSESELACIYLDQPLGVQGGRLPHTGQTCSAEQLIASALQPSARQPGSQAGDMGAACISFVKQLSRCQVPMCCWSDWLPSPACRQCWSVIHHRNFEKTILGCIMANILVMAMQHRLVASST